ncbi:crotonase/enoyl-CoA hydratase family protein [Marinibaculum pumilum]|uniref:Crotonase/enoyl-CoA hydratase family protein n=1 Tax=Marinibaculum pumilum TaxID=1766165 RepID=A0ABV7L2Z9_9PROT
MADFVLYEQTGGVVTLILNDPDTRNALSTQAQWDAVVDACRRAGADPEVRCVIVTGAGKAFCAGGNVKHMKERQGIAGGSPYQIRDGYRGGIQRIPLALYDLDVPTIAAVNGPAIGAGCDLACMCDIRIAADSAKFAESFVKLGIIPGDGGAWLLPRVVGMSKAAELTFTGDMLDANEALSCGLVSKVVPAAELMSAAQDLAGRIAANPGHALRMSKRLLREGQHVRLDTLLEMSAAFQALAHATEDHAEAVDAFLEKRAPAFKGR